MKKYTTMITVAIVLLCAAGCSKNNGEDSGGKVPKGAVDLGLSVYWAECNLGASAPEGHGDLFAWGETETKEKYDWESYKWRGGDDYNAKFTKYCNENETNNWAGAGAPDGKTVLDLSDDAAHVKLGNKWRMPTLNEWAELTKNCTWTQAIQNGVIGFLGVAPNGNTIFLPCIAQQDDDYTGLPIDDIYGCYLSSSLYQSTSAFAYIQGVTFGRGFYIYGDSRCVGRSVRPVLEK